MKKTQENTHALSFWIAEEQWTAARIKSAQLGFRSVSEFVRHLLKEALNDNKKK